MAVCSFGSSFTIRIILSALDESSTHGCTPHSQLATFAPAEDFLGATGVRPQDTPELHRIFKISTYFALDLRANVDGRM